MKALSIKQPWASLIAKGHKTVELRSWRTHYRGRIVICSGSRAWPGYAPDGPLGVTVCTVDLVDVRPVVPRVDAHAACVNACEIPVGWYAWILKNPQQLQHVPVKGRLGIFDLPADVRGTLEAGGHTL